MPLLLASKTENFSMQLAISSWYWVAILQALLLDLSKLSASGLHIAALLVGTLVGACTVGTGWFGT